MTKMKIAICLLAGMALARGAAAQDSLQRLSITQDLDLEAVQALQDRLRQQSLVREAQISDYLKEHKLSSTRMGRNGRVLEIRRIASDNTPLYHTTFNIDAAHSTATSALWTGGRSKLNLNGESMVLGLWDGGPVRQSHQEFGGRVQIKDNSRYGGPGRHASHVAGTMVAAGVNPDAKGMAPRALLHAYNNTYDELEMAMFGASGFLVSNHSYGYCTDPDPRTLGGCNWALWRFGYYDNWARDWDDIAYTTPYYLMVKSAGNSSNRGINKPRPGYDMLSGGATVKNVMVVGGIKLLSSYNDALDFVLYHHSSTGPTDDGRIKPDIVGKGVHVLSVSSASDRAYRSGTGTSMAAPNVSGSLILLQQHYNNLNGKFMKSATLRGLALHSANEAGDSPGPDYRFGWGLLDMEAAAEIISTNSRSSLIEEHSLSDGEQYQKPIEATGLSDLAVTICWTDPAGTPLPESPAANNVTTPMLVNDLDLRVTKNDTVYLPWILDPDNPSAAAGKGDNFRDNIEKVEISNPDPGRYTITVSHKPSRTYSKQDFSLIVTGIAVDCAAESIDKLQFSNITTESATVRWEPTSPISYYGRYRERGSTRWIGFTTRNNIVKLDRLSAGTVYDIQLRALCSSSDRSAYASTLSFQTACDPARPANVRFSEITTSGLLVSWDTVRAVQSYSARYRIKGGRNWINQEVTRSHIRLDGLESGGVYEIRVRAKCGAGLISEFSLPERFSTYCMAAAQNSDNEWIERVQIGSIDSESGSSDGYEDFRSLTTKLKPRAAVKIGLQAGQKSFFPRYWGAWIDYNQNGQLSDIGELILSGQVDGNALSEFEFRVPVGIPLGKTLLRISIAYNEVPTACGSYPSGETEDYTINIVEKVNSGEFVPIDGRQPVRFPDISRQLSIYPNPSSERISFNLGTGLEGREVSIINVSGQVVFKRVFNNRMIVDIAGFSSGVYIVRIETSTGIELGQFIKN